MQGVLYEEPSIWVFLLITMVMGGTAAWQAGRAVASVWKPRWQMVFYVLLLGWAVRFVHFALFGGTFLSPHYYMVDTLILLAFAFAGWRAARSQQMARQYEWLFTSSMPGSWQRKV